MCRNGWLDGDSTNKLYAMYQLLVGHKRRIGQRLLTDNTQNNQYIRQKKHCKPIDLLERQTATTNHLHKIMDSH